MGNLLWFILVGFIAGSLAKMVMPGDKKEPSGCLMTILLGIGGAVLMGFIADLFLGGGNGGLIPSLFGATLGAVILIWLFRNVGKS